MPPRRYPLPPVHLLSRVSRARILRWAQAAQSGSGQVAAAGAAVLPVEHVDIDGAATRRAAGRGPIAILANTLFIAFAIVYTIGATMFGCSGSVSTGSGTTSPSDPNRALGTYTVSSGFGESESRIFFGYWLNGDNDIPTAAAQAFRNAMVPIENTATVTIVPNSILYEETALSLNTGGLVTVSISGTWAYSGPTTIQANWGSAFVTASTFPPTPPFNVATVGTLLNGPVPNDAIFANNIGWTQLSSVQPGPLAATFVRSGG